jgi:hypothetical protein
MLNKIEELRLDSILNLLPDIFIDQINKLNSFDTNVLYMGFSYGKTIINQGNYLIHSAVDETIIDKYFGTNKFPLSMNLSKNIEEYILSHEIYSSKRLIKDSSFIGIEPKLNLGHSYPFQTISSGARNTFLLPRVSEKKANKRMFHALNIDNKAKIPTDYNNHFEVFELIASNNLTPNLWQSDLIVFSPDWVNHMANSMDFREYFSVMSYQDSLVYHSYVKFQILWQHFMLCANKKNFISLLTPFLLDIIKQLLLIAIKAIPGYAPVISEKIAPLQSIQTSYLEYYGLEYNPTVISLQYLEPNKPVYYSLQKLESTMSSINYDRRSALQDMLKIKDAIYGFFDMLHKDSSIIFFELKNVKFDFFHIKGSTNQGLNEINSLIVDDERFQMIGEGIISKKPVAENASFFRGVIRISENNN